MSLVEDDMDDNETEESTNDLLEIDGPFEPVAAGKAINYVVNGEKRTVALMRGKAGDYYLRRHAWIFPAYGYLQTFCESTS